MTALFMSSLRVSVSFMCLSILWMVSFFIRAPTVYNDDFAISVLLLYVNHTPFGVCMPIAFL